MKTISIKLIALSILIAGFTAGCDKDDATVNPVATGEKPKILITTTVGQSSYVGTLKDLTVGSVTNDNSYEHVDKAATFVYKDMVFVAEHWMGDKVHKYIRTSDAVLQSAGSMTLPAGGQGSCMTFKSSEKAYIGMTGHGTVYVFNPTTLEHIKTIDLTSYGIGDNNPDPAALIVRDDKLFVCLSQNITMYSAHDSGYVAVINSNTDVVEKIIVDERVTSLGGQYNRSIFMDENGDIYMYSSGVWGFQPGAKDGVLRIKNGETEFDPTYYFSPRSQTIDGLEGGMALYAMTFCYGGNGKAFVSMLVPALTSDPPDYENDKNAQPIMLDLYAGTAQKINLPPSSMYASVGIVKLDDIIIFGGSTQNGDGLYTYNMVSGEAGDKPVVTTVGKPQFMCVFEND